MQQQENERKRKREEEEEEGDEAEAGEPKKKRQKKSIVFAGSDHLDPNRLALWGWLLSLFRNTGFIFMATREILSQRQPAGVRWFAPGTRVKRRFETRKRNGGNANDDTIFRQLIHIPEPNDDTTGMNKQQSLSASPLTAETVYDYATLMSQRMVESLPPNVAIADVAFGAVARDFLIYETFDIARYHAMQQPLTPEIGLFVLEALHPTHLPEPRIVIYPIPGRVSVCNVYLYLFRHSSLRIPLLTDYDKAGVLASRQRIDPTASDAWLSAFVHLIPRQAAVAWDKRYPGLQTPQFAVASEWLPKNVEVLTRQLYDGWMWVLAGLHWWCLHMAHNVHTYEEYCVARISIRHYLAAMYLARYNAASAPFETMDVSNTVLHSCTRWLTSVSERSTEAYNANSLDDLLGDWEADGIVTCALYTDYISGQGLKIEEPIRVNANEVLEDSVMDYHIAIAAWRVVLGKLDAGIKKYTAARLYI